MKIFRQKQGHDPDEAIDPSPPRGLNRKTIYLTILAAATLLVALILGTSRQEAPGQGPASEEGTVDPMYGGIFELPEQAALTTTPPPPSTPPAWATALDPRESEEEAKSRASAFRSAMSSGGGLLYNRGAGSQPSTEQDGHQSNAIGSGKTETPPRTLLEGSTIEAVLEAPLNSDRPGPVKARVTQDVLDSNSLSETLIPVGTRVLGAMAADGIGAVSVSWHRLIFPDGSTMDLNQLPSLDGGGGGLVGDVDRHRAAFFGKAVLMTLIGATTAYTGAQVSQHAGVFGGAVGQQLGVTTQNTMTQVRRRPTVSVPQGHRFQIWVTEDLQF